MQNLSMKRATIYLDDDLHRALKLKSAESDQPISVLVNHAVRVSLEEDLDDLTSIESRKTEKTISYQEFLSHLKSSGQI
jgi:hypothetical protein